MKKYLKTILYTFLMLSILIFVSGILVFSHPFFLNTYVNLLVKCSGTDPDTFEFHTYSKEEFAAEYLNTSLTSKDDFISLFESRYGTENKSDSILIVTYNIQDPEDRSIHTLYGINKYTDFVYKSTFKEQLIDENTGELLKENQTTNISCLGNGSFGV